MPVLNASEKYSALPIESALSDFNAHTDTGFLPFELDHKIKTFGSNELFEQEQESLLSKFVDQLKNPLILLLLGSAGISVLLGHVEDAISITLAILIVISGIHSDLIDFIFKLHSFRNTNPNNPFKH